ncbi:MAG: AraC family transcriptional regulator [Clostridia bacterium]|nr:AraC family transcriptional regulator [Clostridia bacterium]
MGESISINNLNLKIFIGSMHLNIPFISVERLTFSIGMHSHGNHGYELHYITEGCGSLIANKEQYNLEKGIMYMTGPGILHEQLIDQHDPMSELCIYFEVLSVEKPNCIEDAFLQSAFLNTNFWFGRDDGRLANISERICTEATARYIGYSEVLRAAAIETLIAAVRNYTENRFCGDAASHIMLDDRRGNIMDNAFLWNYKDLTIELLAKELGLSVRQTERAVKKHYGITFKEKRRESQMNDAARLLARSTLLINTVAERTGFCTLEYFCSVFKKYYGTTPLSYRRTAQESGKLL